MKKKKTDAEEVVQENLPLPDETALPDKAPAESEDQKETEQSETPAEEKSFGDKKMEEDVTLFRELFPEVTAKSIPKEVWDRVETGETLSASYALYALKKQKEEERIREINEKNAKIAPPRIRHDGAEYDYFSPEAVQKMSRGEIRQNYRAILASMDQWN